MRPYSLTHLSDGRLIHDLKSLVARDRTVTAAMLAHIAEVDARKLYLPAAYPSMFAYCVHELRLSEDAAYRRITAARVAREFPAIFEVIADGRVNLTTVLLLAPCLTHGNVDDLLNAATHKTKTEVEALIAERFPSSEELPMALAVPSSASRVACESASRANGATDPVSDASCQLALERAGRTEPEMAAIAAERFALHLTIGKTTYDKFRYAQELLSHQVAPGDMAEVLDRALDALVEKLETRKFAATTRPRASRRPTISLRHIPAHVKRAVWLRDGGRCTFVSESGERCAARDRIEYDHIDPVARGGETTIANLRLRCRAHNQYAAECEFGVEFMDGMRENARLAAEATARAGAAKREAPQVRVKPAAPAPDPDRDVTPWLRRLGFRATEAQWAAEQCEFPPDATLEERVRRALSFLSPARPSSASGSQGPPKRAA